jgi:hypothetical protein
MEDKLNILHELCKKLEICLRINHKSGQTILYVELGEFECPEQAINFINTHYTEDLDNAT